VTIGIGNAREARKLYVMANSPQKCPVVERAIELLAHGETTVELPASFVLNLPQTEFCVTDEVFGE
jgi:6-phosphogluconolactonase/glucosamine-6-phosphate isomerase/deaminase